MTLLLERPPIMGVSLRALRVAPQEPKPEVRLTPEVEALMNARQMVAQGWCQNRASIVLGGVQHRCAGQAITDGAGGSQLLANNAASLFAQTVGCHPQSIPVWNDAHGRTKEMVLHAFDTTIARAMHPRAMYPSVY